MTPRPIRTMYSKAANAKGAEGVDRMKRTVLVVDDEQNMQAVMRMGEPEQWRRHLTCLRPGERRDTEVPAGVYRRLRRRARDGRHRAALTEGGHA